MSTCASCVHFDRDQASKEGDGTCCAHAPGTGKPDRDYNQPFAYWHVVFDNNFCGEHQPRHRVALDRIRARRQPAKREIKS